MNVAPPKHNKNAVKNLELVLRIVRLITKVQMSDSVISEVFLSHGFLPLDSSREGRLKDLEERFKVDFGPVTFALIGGNGQFLESLFVILHLGGDFEAILDGLEGLFAGNDHEKALESVDQLFIAFADQIHANEGQGVRIDPQGQTVQVFQILGRNQLVRHVKEYVGSVQVAAGVHAQSDQGSGMMAPAHVQLLEEGHAFFGGHLPHHHAQGTGLGRRQHDPHQVFHHLLGVVQIPLLFDKVRGQGDVNLFRR